MSENGTSPEWYYVGHYGQLGPLTFEQMEELARDGVIALDTYVWKPGLANWQQAGEVRELRKVMGLGDPMHQPPPMPTPGFSHLPAPAMNMPAAPPSATQLAPVAPSYGQAPYGTHQWQYLPSNLPVSDKSRVVAGLLNFLPGFGRFYLGYAAHGALQLLLSFCGIGYLWSVLDGIYILSGGVKLDGYGRRLAD